jgi:hypothetical protein
MFGGCFILTFIEGSGLIYRECVERKGGVFLVFSLNNILTKNAEKEIKISETRPLKFVVTETMPQGFHFGKFFSH